MALVVLSIDKYFCDWARLFDHEFGASLVLKLYGGWVSIHFLDDLSFHLYFRYVIHLL